MKRIGNRKKVVEKETVRDRIGEEGGSIVEPMEVCFTSLVIDDSLSVENGVPSQEIVEKTGNVSSQKAHISRTAVRRPVDVDC